MQISEFKTSMVYRVSSRTAWATKSNPFSKKKKNKKTKKLKIKITIKNGTCYSGNNTLYRLSLVHEVAEITNGHFFSHFHGVMVDNMPRAISQKVGMHHIQGTEK